jgi:hypothetical protein
LTRWQLSHRATYSALALFIPYHQYLLLLSLSATGPHTLGSPPASAVPLPLSLPGASCARRRPASPLLGRCLLHLAPHASAEPPPVFFPLLASPSPSRDPPPLSPHSFSMKPPVVPKGNRSSAPPRVHLFWATCPVELPVALPRPPQVLAKSNPFSPS